MISIQEKQLRFDFPEGWDASKFDDWKFYRGQFSKISASQITCNKRKSNNIPCEGAVLCPECGSKRVAGTKGIDILAISPDQICWHIEIKDFRLTRTTSFEFLADVVALKVRDTLAALTVTRFNANDAEERRLAVRALECASMKVVLHLETPPGRRLLMATQQRQLLQQRLRQLLSAIDRRATVVSMREIDSLAWTVANV